MAIVVRFRGKSMAIVVGFRGKSMAIVVRFRGKSMAISWCGAGVSRWLYRGAVQA